jgi:hypothetical protein
MMCDSVQLVLLVLLVLLCRTVPGVTGDDVDVDRILAATPPMAWSSRYALGCANINEVFSVDVQLASRVLVLMCSCYMVECHHWHCRGTGTAIRQVQRHIVVAHGLPHHHPGRLLDECNTRFQWQSASRSVSQWYHTGPIDIDIDIDIGTDIGACRFEQVSIGHALLVGLSRNSEYHTRLGGNAWQRVGHNHNAASTDELAVGTDSITPWRCDSMCRTCVVSSSATLWREQQDIAQMVSNWGAQYIRYVSCGASRDSTALAYSSFSRALNTSNVSIVLECDPSLDCMTATNTNEQAGIDGRLVLINTRAAALQWPGRCSAIVQAAICGPSAKKPSAIRSVSGCVLSMLPRMPVMHSMQEVGIGICWMCCRSAVPVGRTLPNTRRR